MRSISSASRMLTGLNSTPNEGATDWIAPYWPAPAAVVGSRSTAARFRRFRRACRQTPLGDLLLCDGEAFEIDVGGGRKLAQRLLDLLASIDAGRVEVAKVVDVGRDNEFVDGFGRAVEQREAGIAARHHQRDIIHGCHGIENTGQRILFRSRPRRRRRRPPKGSCGRVLSLSACSTLLNVRGLRCQRVLSASQSYGSSPARRITVRSVWTLA